MRTKVLQWNGDTAMALGFVYRIEPSDKGEVWSVNGIRQNRFSPSDDTLTARAAAQSHFDAALASVLEDDCLSDEDVQWVVNDIAELGVKIGNQFFFCYKGRSLVYDDPTHEEGDPSVGYSVGDPMKWRPVFKREFGECIHPINYKNLELIGTVSYDDSDDWSDLPSPPKAGE